MRIGFIPAVLRQIRGETQLDHRGFLLGSREGNEIRIQGARRNPDVADPQLHGAALVGVYIGRARGEVFLTDQDIAFMGEHGTGVALVVAGSRAGFFVREADGTLQAVRSYEEFDVRPHTGADVYREPKRWAAAAAGLLAIPALALAYWLPPSPLELQAREHEGQLIVSWDAHDLAEGGRLEITDASGQTVVQLAAGTASATYSVQSPIVEVRLVSGSRTGVLR